MSDRGEESIVHAVDPIIPTSRLTKNEDAFLQNYNDNEKIRNAVGTASKYALGGLAGGVGVGALALLIKKLLTDKKKRVPVDTMPNMLELKSASVQVAAEEGTSDDTVAALANAMEASKDKKKRKPKVEVKKVEEKKAGVVDTVSKWVSNPGEIYKGLADAASKGVDWVKENPGKSMVGAAGAGLLGGAAIAALAKKKKNKPLETDEEEEIKSASMAKKAEMPQWFATGLTGGGVLAGGALGYKLMRALSSKLEKLRLEKRKREAEAEFQAAISDSLDPGTELSSAKIASADFRNCMSFLDYKANEAYHKSASQRKLVKLAAANLVASIKQADAGISDHLLYGLLAASAITGGLGGLYGWRMADNTNASKHELKAIEQHRLRRAVQNPVSPVIVLKTPEEEEEEAQEKADIVAPENKAESLDSLVINGLKSKLF